MTDLDKLIKLASTDSISDELLAAYIDGNTTEEENTFIESSVPMEDLNDISELVADSLSFEEKLHFYDGDYGLWELGLPPVLDVYDSTNHLNDSNMVRKNYGYKPNYDLDTFDPNIWQGNQRTCAIRAQEIILRDYGIMIPQEDLKKYATEQGWFDPDPDYGGTPKEDVGNILDANGISTTRTDGATIHDIIAELRAGHRVIVDVDADELWVKKEPNLYKKLTTYAKNAINDKVQDFLGLEGANHALIVAGVNVNPENPSDIKVVIIDSGRGDMCVEYDLKVFQDAWKDGNFRMVSTNIPASYQYNYRTHEMEPSGFATSYIPSKPKMAANLRNDFSLSEVYMKKYEEFEPKYDPEESNNIPLIDNESEKEEGVKEETTLRDDRREDEDSTLGSDDGPIEDNSLGNDERYSHNDDDRNDEDDNYPTGDDPVDTDDSVDLDGSM